MSDKAEWLKQLEKAKKLWGFDYIEAIENGNLLKETELEVHEVIYFDDYNSVWWAQSYFNALAKAFLLRLSKVIDCAIIVDSTFINESEKIQAKIIMTALTLGQEHNENITNIFRQLSVDLQSYINTNWRF